MRKRNTDISKNYRIMVVDDEIGILDSLSIILKRNGYDFTGFTNPLEALEALRVEAYDILILDFMMESMHGDEFVEKLREFNNDIYILLLTGFKDLAPPLETIKALDIQAYCEKNDKFDQLILLIESGIKTVIQKQTIIKYNHGLKKILKSVSRIYQIRPVGEILEEILREILPFANSWSAFILVDDIINSNATNRSSIFKGIGDYNTDIESFLSKLNPELMEKIGYARTSKRIVRFKEGVIFPLLNEYNNTMGVIFVESHHADEGLKILEIYSTQAAIALNNAFLHSMVNTKNEELVKTYEELKNRYQDTIEVLRLTVEAKDAYTKGHSERVAFYAEEIGTALGLAKNELEKLRIGGIFHDIGKIATADAILLKTDRLSDYEYFEIKKHPVDGAHILSAVSIFKEVVPLVKFHHERIDGRGYPDGLKGDEIPFLARVLSVADAFDAMTSDRLYREKLSFDQAKKQLIEGSGSQFDSLVVKTFLDFMK